MKAILFDKYGSEEVLYETDIPIPALNSNQVLVELYSTSLNHSDLVERSGGFAGHIDVFPRMTGKDFAGVVKKVGKDVEKFKVGDRVCGISLTGTYAEYIAVDENFVTRVPEGLELSKLGAFPVVGITAWTAVVNKAKVSSGQRILVVGGAGGVGHIAVQLAKSFGAYVVTTCGTNNIDFVTSLGADEVFDYNTPNYWMDIKDIDTVIDTVGINQAENMSVLKEGGRFISMVKQPDSKLAEKYKVNAEFMTGEISSDTLQNLVNTYADEKLILRIDKSNFFNLEEIKKAHSVFALKRNVGGKWLIKFK